MGGRGPSTPRSSNSVTAGTRVLPRLPPSVADGSHPAALPTRTLLGQQRRQRGLGKWGAASLHPNNGNTAGGGPEQGSVREGSTAEGRRAGEGRWPRLPDATSPSARSWVKSTCDPKKGREGCRLAKFPPLTTPGGGWGVGVGGAVCLRETECSGLFQRQRQPFYKGILFQ